MGLRVLGGLPSELLQGDFPMGLGSGAEILKESPACGAGSHAHFDKALQHFSEKAATQFPGLRDVATIHAKNHDRGAAGTISIKADMASGFFEVVAHEAAFFVKLLGVKEILVKVDVYPPAFRAFLREFRFPDRLQALIQ